MDKVTAYNALKTIVSEVVPDDMAPFSEQREDEQIEWFIAPISVQARMVGSSYMNMYGNKVLIELKRKLKEIYES